MANPSILRASRKRSGQVQVALKDSKEQGTRLNPTSDRFRARAVDVREACRMLGGIGLTTLYKLIGEGSLVPIKIGRRTVLSIEAIEAFLTSAQRAR